MSSTENLTKLKRTRGGHRRSAKKMIGELEAELTTSSTEFDLVRISQLKRNLEEKTTLLEKLDTEILDLLEEENDIDEEIEKADEYKGIAYTAIIKAEKCSTGAPITRSVSASTLTVKPSTSDSVITPMIAIETVSHVTAESPSSAEALTISGAASDKHVVHIASTSSTSSSSSVAPSVSTASLATEHSRATESSSPSVTPSVSTASLTSAVAEHSEAVFKTSVKLPKLTLRPFTGDLTHWFTFWDSFSAAVHTNNQLVKVDKFNYLKSLLSGAALEAIQGLALTDANYNEAVTILQRRFGNRQQIIDKHMNEMLKVEAVTSSRNVTGLRRLFDSIESHIRSLNSLGVKLESYSSLLSSVLLNKLPEEVQLLISRKVSEEEWGLNTLMKVFQEELQARERVTVDVSTSKSGKATNGRPINFTGATLLSGIGNSNHTISCCYCNQTHLSKDCRVVTQVEARRQILRKAGRCFVCLRMGHISRECRSKTKCSKCSRRHHISICLGNSAESSSEGVRSRQQGGQQGGTKQCNQGSSIDSQASKLNVNAPSFSSQQKTTSLYVSANQTVLLQTALATIYNPDQSTSLQEVRAVLDSGSQRSYISQRVKDSLLLQPEEVKKMAVFTFGSTEKILYNCELVHVVLKTLDGEIEMKLLTSPVICEPLTDQPLSLCIESYEHLSDLHLADSSTDSPIEVDLLIGSDYYWQFATGRVRRGKDGPVAVETKLGWVLSGPAPMVNHALLTTTHTLKVDSREAECLSETLRAFWELESFGISGPQPSVHQDFVKKIVFEDGRYEVCLPWKKPRPILPDNYALSQRRLQGLLRRLRLNPEILQEYDSIIRKQLELGIVQLVSDQDLGVVGEVHYLPHHAVVKRNRETTKVRVVYDASARSGGRSLNDCLYTGPSFNQKIFDILLRFRTYPIAITADIEKAFLMVSITEEDRDASRFLWIDDLTKPDPEILIFRFTRVVFGVSSSPFLLNATIDYHLKQFAIANPVLSDLLQRSIYVDDVVTGADDVDAAQEFYKESKRVFQEGGFNLRKFATNVPELQEYFDVRELPTPIPEDKSEETYAKSTLGRNQCTNPTDQKVLGVRWNSSTDQLFFSVQEIAVMAEKEVPTKRRVMSLVGKFYDPIGFLSPIVIKFKVFFKDLNQAGLEWDEELSGDIFHKWQSLIESLKESPIFSVPRFYLRDVNIDGASFSLHGFCDASKEAYAAVVYLVAQTDSQLHVRFLASKTRVAPCQELTIPRLELLSSLLLARLIDSITKILSSNLPLGQPTCYTDSQVSLYWIIGVRKEWKQFVQNRVSEIRDLVPVSCWRHCPGHENPADIPSRGITPMELSVNKLWHYGPESILMTHAGLPDQSIGIEVPSECLSELKSKKRKTHVLLSETINFSIENIIPCKKYSSIDRLFSVTLRVLRFANAFKRAVKGHDSTDKSSCHQPPHLKEAEKMWIQEAQQQLLSDRHFPVWKKQFGLYCEDGVWRCGGRLHYADISPSAKHPIILPRSHHLTKLIVLSAHSRVYHNGTRETLTEVRSRFWIIKGRSLVKKIIRDCTTCRRYEGPRYQTPPPPPLPEFRVSQQPPFGSTGVDFAGPFYIRYPGNKETNKVWLCLFTCAVTRAVHLDLVPDMSTSAFLRCLKRFVARRGIPQRIISDNAQTFKCASKMLQTMLKQSEISQYLASNKILWTFNVEKAPWWGGLFERMIKSTKRCLRKVIGRAKLHHDELLTVLVEIEGVINSRPLTYLSSDDLTEPLTPSHFLCGRRILNLPDDLSEVNDSDAEFTPGASNSVLTRRLKYLNATLNQFWCRWRNEYLLELREAHRHHGGRADVTSPTIGDIVLVEDEDKPRGLWKLAKVTDLIIGTDCRIRGAILKVASASGNNSVLQRPIQRLYPLEIYTSQEDAMPKNVEVPEDIEKGSESRDKNLSLAAANRPQRAAAIKAKKRIAVCAELEKETEL